MKPELCLGTAQFGLAYGITNKYGQVSEASVGELLNEGQDAGFRWLDTAQAYGNAELVLGRQLPIPHNFRLISKLPPQPQPEFTIEDQNNWDNSLMLSLKHLHVSALDSLLLHSPADLSKPGGALLEDWLLSLRNRGLVRRIGVSIYSNKDLVGVKPDLLDLVQLPLSLFDQRLLEDGTVKWLRSQGTDIHARSLYLQGLLLTPAKHWPSWVSNESRAHHHLLEVMADERGLRLIDLALGFAKSQIDLEAVVVGVCNVQQMSDLLAVWSGISPWGDNEWRAWSLSDPKLLDPRNWVR